MELGQTLRALAARGGDIGQPLGEDAARAFGVGASEPAHLQLEADLAALPGQVAQAAAVPAVDATGTRAAERAGGLGRAHAG